MAAESDQKPSRDWSDAALVSEIEKALETSVNLNPGAVEVSVEDAVGWGGGFLNSYLGDEDFDHQEVEKDPDVRIATYLSNVQVIVNAAMRFCRGNGLHEFSTAHVGSNPKLSEQQYHDAGMAAARAIREVDERR